MSLQSFKSRRDANRTIVKMRAIAFGHYAAIEKAAGGSSFGPLSSLSRGATFGGAPGFVLMTILEGHLYRHSSMEITIGHLQ